MADEGGSNRRDWSKIIGWVIAIPASTVALFALADRFSSGPSFATSAASATFRIPPLYGQSIRQCGFAISDADEGLKDIEQLERADGTENVPLRTKVPELKGVITATIRNAGDVAASDVRLKVGDIGLAVLEWDDGTAKEIPFRNEIKIGTLEIEKTINITAWTAESVDPENSLLLIHSTGRHRIPLSRENDSDWSAFLSPLWIVVYAMGALFALAMYQLMRAAQRDHFSRAPLEIQIGNTVLRRNEKGDYVVDKTAEADPPCG